MSYYIAALLLLSGICCLIIDVSRYKIVQMNKERKGAVIIGWCNVYLGLLSFVGYWVYEKWFWK